jgi:hypothetical protein
MVKASSISTMGMSIRETTKTGILMVMENIPGKTDRCIKAISSED